MHDLRFEWAVVAIRRAMSAVWAFVLLAPLAAKPATLSISHSEAGDRVSVEGKLELADGPAFAKLADGLNQAVISLNSPGGNLVAGLAIGRLVRLRGFATAVPDRALCASACALAWLGGKTRYLGPHSALGFHGAAVMSRGQAVESSVGTR